MSNTPQGNTRQGGSQPQQGGKSRHRRPRYGDPGIKNDAIHLMRRLAELEPHIHRAYKYTLGRLLLDWSALLVFRIDRMLMLPDKGLALEEVAATVRTIEVTMLNLVALRGMPEASVVTEADVASLCVRIEEQARSLWRANRDRLACRETSRGGEGGAIPPRQGAPSAR